jgi:hypothetical protein
MTHCPDCGLWHDPTDDCVLVQTPPPDAAESAR